MTAARKDEPLILPNGEVTIVPGRSLHRKLAQVMWEAERIPKRGRAPAAMGGFEFVQVGDAADVIRKALAEHQVSMIPSAIEVVGEAEHPTSSGKMMTTLTVRTTWTLTDGESGETAVIQSLGSGADMGDKAAPKAQSNAMKYALLMGFLLSTGDDPELSDSSDRQRRPARTDGGGGLVDGPVEDRAPKAPDRANGGIVGTVITQGSQDFELRQGPDGPSLPFRVKEGRSSVIVMAHNDNAEDLRLIRDAAIGARVQVWGEFSDESFVKNDRDVKYRVLHLSRIVGPDWEIPAPVAASVVATEPDLSDAEMDGIFASVPKAAEVA